MAYHGETDAHPVYEGRSTAERETRRELDEASKHLERCLKEGELARIQYTNATQEVRDAQIRVQVLNEALERMAQPVPQHPDGPPLIAATNGRY